jgi:translation initiation factor 3 subunit B
MEFYDVDNKTLSIKEHYRANQVMWDPSGRTVATIVSQPIGGGHFKFAMDNGYILWTFQGKQIYQQSYETFYQFQWRPREDLLGKLDTDKVIKKLKKYEKQFDKADKELSQARFLEETKGKRALRAAFRERMKVLNEIRRQQRKIRLEIMNGYDSDDESNYVMKEVTIETV